MMSVEELRREYRKFVAKLMIDCPFLAMLMKYTPVYAMPEHMRGVAPMFTDGKAVYVDVEHLSERSPADRLFIYAHEVMHIMLMHVMRAKRLVDLLKSKGYVINASIKKLINLCSDVEVNRHVSELLKYRPDDAVMPLDISALVSDAEKKSFERMVMEILDKARSGGAGTYIDLTDVTSRLPDCSADLPLDGGCGGRSLSEEGREDRSGGGAGKDEVINEGSEDIVRASGKELEGVIKRKLLEALITAKSIGTVPAGIERLVNELAKPKVSYMPVDR